MGEMGGAIERAYVVSVGRRYGLGVVLPPLEAALIKGIECRSR